MSIFDIFKNKSPVNVDKQIQDISYQMNEYSTDARRRSDIFVTVAEQQGLEVLPGRFGGEYNNDMLAAGEKNGQFLLMLGMKITGSDGGIQLDKQSMGCFLQFSKPWLDMVIYSLRLSGTQFAIADKIERHVKDNTISLAIAFIDMETKKLNIIPLTIQD
ncbi:hypothetical protein [Shewanella decolorationis]|uniref:Uncharacterized protein n=1 Tax=Shewanella decolorationis S12 TaxID=1353536 RepID=A0ABP2Z2T3_9GAMM|nr:hypothetical protein [Shewanella decolorationis]ESE40928.1 hypothetical protein SHD_2485 [Shewanella decolorationis S12]GLR30796.1 hypothetical protein GCM10007922_03530 [Shewanella decolorationis]